MKKSSFPVILSSFLLKTLMVATANVSAAPEEPPDSTLYFAGQAEGSSSGLYALESTGKLTQIISGNPSQFRNVDINTVSEKAVFVADRNQNGAPGASESRGILNVYTVDLDGENFTAITDNPHIERQPKFSPDGELVSYVRSEAGRHHLILEAYQTQAGRTLISADEIQDVSWAPDGQRLLVAKRTGLQSSMVILDLHPMEPIETTTLWTDGGPLEGEGEPRPSEQQVIALTWSPDGEQVAYVLRTFADNQQDLFVMQLGESSTRQISPSGSNVQGPVQWSQTNQHVLYAASTKVSNNKERTNGATHTQHIYLSDLEGNTQRVTEEEHWYSRPVFAPDESRIAFLYGGTGEASILSLGTINRDGSDAQVLYDQVTSQSFLQWHKGIYIPIVTEEDANYKHN